MKRSRVGLFAVAVIVATVAAGCGTVTPPSPSSVPSVASAPTGLTPSSSTVPSPLRTPAATVGPAPSPPPPGFIPLSELPVPPGRIPILYYHRVQPIPAAYASWSKVKRQRFTTYDTLPQAFAAQLDWLRDHGYTTILPRDLADHWDRRTMLPARPVMITFDDGSRDWVKRVLPMLTDHGMVAEFYLTLDAIKHGNLTWTEVRRLAAAGNGIGAHDVHHVQLTALGPGHKSASPEVMWAEVNGARETIGANVGVYPDSMAYVGGGYDSTLQRLVEEAGYRSARGIARGVIQSHVRRFAMQVVRIGVHDDVVTLTGGVLVPGLPTFTARMAGVSDK